MAVVTWNPADKRVHLTLSEGNLRGTGAAGAIAAARATESKAADKWYFEIKYVVFNAGREHGYGIATSVHALSTYPGASAGATVGYGYYEDGRKINNGAFNAYGNSFTTNDIIGIAIDLTAGKIWFAKNNVWQAAGNPAAGTNPAFTGLSGTYFPFMAVDLLASAKARFAVADFSYAPPAGFISLEADASPTNLFDGKINLERFSTEIFDGKAVVDILADARLLDGRAVVKSAATGKIFNGKAEVVGLDTEIFDGKAEVAGPVADLFDGKVNVQDLDTTLFNGKLHIVRSVSKLFDGKVKIEHIPVNNFNGKAIVEGLGVANYLDGKTFIQGLTKTNLFDGKCIIGSFASINAVAPTPTASFRIGKRIEGDCPTPTFTCTAYHGRNPSIVASAPVPTCSMRVGLSLDATVPVPTCCMVADTHHLATIFGNVPTPCCTIIASTENIATIYGKVPCPGGKFTTTIGNVGSICGRCPVPRCSMRALVGTVVNLYGKVPVPGPLVRFHASPLNVTITLEGDVPVPTMTSTVLCSLPSLILRYERGTIR